MNTPRKKLLMVEADKFLQNMYQMKLKDGFDILWLNTYDESFMEKVIDFNPDLISLNILTGGAFDGFEGIRRLKAHDKTKNIPVVFLTNQGQPRDIKMGKDLGCADYIIAAYVIPSDVVAIYCNIVGIEVPLDVMTKTSVTKDTPPFSFLKDKENTSKNTSATQNNLHSKRDQKAEDYEKILIKERKRTVQEKYSYKRLRDRWMVAPFLLFLIGGLFMLVMYLSKEDIDSTIVGVFISNIVLLGIIQGLNDGWDTRLKAKREVLNEKPNSTEFSYKEDYNYTDSFIFPILYFIAKIYCYLSTIIIAAGVVALAFSWLGSLTIAPTTVIIILLIIVIMNQEKSMNR